MSETSVDARGFLSMVDDLVTLSGKDWFEVLVPSVGQLLKAAINLTPVRSAADIARRVSKHASFIEFNDGTIISVWKKAGDAEMFFEPSNWDGQGPAPHVRGGSSWHDMTNRHWSVDRWARYQAKLALVPSILEQRKRALQEGRGLLRQSWWRMAEDLGLEPGLAAAYVRNAHGVAQNGDIRQFKEGFGQKLLEQGQTIVELRNTNPLFTSGKIDASVIFQGALAARELAFQRDLELGVFDDLTRRAQRYPGIFTN